MGYKKKAIMVTLDPLTLVAKKTKVSKRREKVVVQPESEGTDDEDISDLKKITAFFANGFNRKSESEYETSEYYDNSTNYDLFVDNDDDLEIFNDAIESASENFNENHIVSQKDYDESEVDHNDSEENDHLVDKFIKKFN
nr:hypothetical protein [Tanacetum cinerariifolium]